MNFVVRAARNDDAEKVFDLLHLKGMENLICVMPTDSKRKFIEDFSKKLFTEHRFIAEVVYENGQSKIVGYSLLKCGVSAHDKFCGAVFLVVDFNYQNSGVGKMLMEKALNLSDNWLSLKRVEFLIYCDNFKAIEFAEKFGFEREALKQKSVIRNGQFIDEYIMARVIYDE